MTTDEPASAGEELRGPSAPASADIESWVLTAVVTLVAYLLVSCGVMSQFAEWQVPLFVGAVAGLAAASVLQAGLVAGFVAAPGLTALAPSTTAGAHLGVVGWALGAAVCVAAACAVAALRTRRPDRSAATEWWVAALLIVWLLGNLWAPLLESGAPTTSYGSLQATTLRAVPKPGTYVNDDALYLRVYYLLHHGEGYYDAFRHAWLGLAHQQAFPSSVTSVRLPTMYWLWRVLPADPFSIVYLFLAFVSVGVVASACITGQLVGVRFAPLAAAALVAYAMGSAATVYVTYIDLPSTCIALVGIALFVRARLTGSARYLWAAAAVVTCAALTREILIYVTLLALLTAVLEPAENRMARMWPWIASLGVFALGYAAHASVVSSMMVARSTPITYFKGSPLFAFDSIRRFTDHLNGNGVLLVALLLMALAGAVASRKRAGLPFAVFAVGAIVAPILTMLKIGNPGIDAMGNQVNYWGNLYIPFALAMWPTWVVWLRIGQTSAK